ncbi:MAG: RNase adapter RapZ [Clostridiales bacterium]|nr:RNase adapter RapZ [Clostridiales bacterium]
MEFLVITGLSGAGKSRTSAYLEDMGFYCVDNLPPEFIPRLAEMCRSGGRYARMAVVTDVRGGTSFDMLFEALDKVKKSGGTYKILYIEASEQAIINRYKETRHLHPLARPGEELSDTIRREVMMLTELRGAADYIIDTTGLSTAALRARLLLLFENGSVHRSLSVSLISFGFKYGIPLDADIVWDVRFLPNPFYVNELRALDGRDALIVDFLKKSPTTEELLRRLRDMFAFCLPCYRDEGKAKLVVALGCTGGKHRSVFVAEELYRFIKEDLGYAADCRHRDLDKI